MKEVIKIFAFIFFVLLAWTCTKEDGPIAGTGNKLIVNTNTGIVLTANSVTLNSSLTTGGLETIIEKGYCWNKTQSPTINDNVLKILANADFSATITGLTPGTNYSVRAYVKSATGIMYGNEIKFKTLSPPILSTTSLTAITNTSATSGGNITADGGAPVTARGVCWSLVDSPTIVNAKTQDGSGVGTFASSITGLAPNTTYYLRAYATNFTGTAYGQQIAFTTLSALSTLTTNPATSIATTSAISGGNITADGGAPVTARGVCWNLVGSPTVINTRTLDGAGIGLFTSVITGLAPNTTYFARSYATNAAGTAYGQEISFTTRTELPSITTNLASSITTTSATSGGNISTDGGAPVTARGVCWNTTGAPTVANTRTLNGTGIGAFSSTISGLTPNTTYYLRSYATNTAGTSYGQEISFTTAPLPPSLPTLTTVAASSIATTSAISGGNVTVDGGAPVTARGICWNVVGSPTIINSRTLDGSGLGSYASTMTGLAPNTTYFVRAYATNSAGTSYGQQISFTTAALPPSLSTVTTSLISSITATSAVSGGNIIADGGAPITARGVCWNTTGTPTIANPTTQNGTGVGAFTSSITGIAPNTTYYVRAYATNAAGTSYGEQLSFTTAVLSETCSINGVTNGTVYSMQAPPEGSVFTIGNPYRITMASSIFAFGQASEVALYNNEVKVFSFGTFLLFNEAPGNTRTFTIPALPPSTCYTIRVLKPEGLITAVYVSPRFEIR